MKEHHRLGKSDAHAVSVLSAVAALLEAALFFQSIDVFPGEPLAHVGDEVGLNAVKAAQNLRRFYEIIFFFGEAIEELIIAIEDKIVVVEELHIKRRRGAGYQARRLVHGIMLVKDVGWNREDAAGLPFESPLTAIFVPHGSRPLTVDDHHRLVEQLAARHGLGTPKAKQAQAKDYIDTTILEEIKKSGFVDRLYGR